MPDSDHSFHEDASGNPAGSVSDPSPSEKLPCAECSSPQPQKDLLQYGSVSICIACKDAVIRKLQLGGYIGQGLWQDGESIIAENGKIFPQRCFKCNVPAIAAYRRVLTWVPIWPGLGFLACIIAAAALQSPHPFSAGLIAYVIANRILRKKANITVHLCLTHAKQRLMAFITLAVSAVVAPVALVSGSLAYSQGNSAVLPGGLFFIGSAAFIALIIANRIVGKLATLKSVKDDLLIIHGAGRDFLDSVPRWHGFRSDR